MMFQRNYRIQILSGLVIIISLSGFQTSAQETVNTVQPKTSGYRESFQALKDLNNKANRLTIDSEPENLTKSSLASEIANIADLSESYFQAAGFQFEKRFAAVHFAKLKDAEDYTTFAPIYYLNGTKNGDENARLIYSVQANPKFKEEMLSVFYDPIYTYKHSSSLGHFETSTHTLYIGPKVLSGEILRTNTVLRHEIQHYLERMKVNQGQQSLNRLALGQPELKESHGPYSDFLNVDELEAHLRDLRMFMHEQELAAIDAKLAQAMASLEKLKLLQAIRIQHRAHKIEVLKKIIADGKIMVGIIEAELKKSQELFVSVDKATNDPEVIFKNLPGPFTTAYVNLAGLFPNGKIPEPADAKKAIVEIIGWSKVRIHETEKEFEQLTAKIKEK